MPVAKLKAADTPDAMKSEEGNDTVDTFIRQAIGKEPLLSFSRAGDSPVQWIQLLHALDQQDLPGWPLLSPLKVQMHKCEKCVREFCSPINYRRHLRVHHRLKKLDKDSTKNRDLLGAFWDKLSLDDAKEIVSFKDVTLEDVPGLTIVNNLTSLMRKPGFSALPQVYLRAGSALLDIVQARHSRFPMSSQELFCILDDASEKTFLHGIAVSMQKYVFDGEAGKIGLETKNLVACTSFLMEQKLVKAWLADKDAEALRCQKLLVEEEEAAQKRQAELLERKRQKKLRQKEQKAKEQSCGENVGVKESIGESLEDAPAAETSSPLALSDSDTHSADMLPEHVPSSLEPLRLSNPDVDADTEAQSGSGSGFTDLRTDQNTERQKVQGSGHRHIIVARWQVPQRSQRGVPNGFHATENSHASKLGVMQKHGTHRELRTAPIVNGNKVWSRKAKPENDGESLKTRVQKEAENQPDQNKNHEVFIGSISVTLGNCSQEECNNLAVARDDSLAEHQMPKKNNFQEKPGKPESVQGGTNRSTIKLWRPVSRHGAKGTMQVQNGNRESELDMVADRSNDQTLSSESCQGPFVMGNDNGRIGKNSSILEESVPPESLQFSSHAAKAFLAERWKKTLATDHVKLVLSPESELPGGCPEIPNECQPVASLPSDNYKRRILGNAENWLVNLGPFDSSAAAGTAKAKYRTKHEKGVKIKYIPKQRAVT